MIITIDLHKFILAYLFMLDSKRNIIMDGIFTKIYYSNTFFTMNGLYMLFPIEITSLEENTNKRHAKFNPYTKPNLNIVQEFAKLEYKILECYKINKHCDLKISNGLSKQMYSGVVKIYKEYNKQSGELDNTAGELSTQYIIKISGIWESRDEIGLTYKIFEANENNIV